MRATLIDQDRRKELLRRIRRNDRTAVTELADLYQEAGYATLAAACRRAETNEIAWGVLQEQARGWF